MEFTVRKFDLLQELTLIQGVVERKTTIPILANVLARAADGELGILATDLEIGTQVRMSDQADNGRFHDSAGEATL